MLYFTQFNIIITKRNLNAARNLKTSFFFRKKCIYICTNSEQLKVSGRYVHRVKSVEQHSDDSESSCNLTWPVPLFSLKNNLYEVHSYFHFHID